MNQLTPLVDEGLGNSAHLLDLGDCQALAVDPSLDLRAADRAAATRGLRIAYAAETHLHADFLSGARRLSADHGSKILARAAGDRSFDHVRLGDGDEVDLGGLTLRALATPGHTVEHLSFLILDGAREVGVFTALVPLDAAMVRRFLADGGSIVDVRPVVDYAAGHLPGPVSIPLHPQYATWLGWLLPPDVPIVVLRNSDQDPEEILWPAPNIGDTVAGELAGGWPPGPRTGEGWPRPAWSIHPMWTHW